MVSLSPLSVPNSSPTRGNHSSHNNLMTEINKERGREDDKTEEQRSERWPERKENIKKVEKRKRRWRNDR